MTRRDQADHYSRQAKKEGYRARSVYKLQELQRRFNVLQRGASVLDIGAAPGSWSQYAAGIVGPGGRVVAVDLKPIDVLVKHANVTTICGDIFATETLDLVRSAGPFDAVISDAAPNTSGNRVIDTARSSALVEQVVAICGEVLRPGGNLIAKLFQGGQEQELLAAARNLFEAVRLVKPKASRSQSFETFLVGTGLLSTPGDMSVYSPL